MSTEDELPEDEKATVRSAPDRSQAPKKGPASKDDAKAASKKKKR